MAGLVLLPSILLWELSVAAGEALCPICRDWSLFRLSFPQRGPWVPLRVHSPGALFPRVTREHILLARGLSASSLSAPSPHGGHRGAQWGSGVKRDITDYVISLYVTLAF